MQTFWILWKRETATYFRTPLALTLLVLSLFLTGLNFYASVSLLNHGASNVSIVEVFFNTLFFWGAFLLLCPLITMRLFSEEYRTGTIESLMTAPVRDIQVVLAKFFAAFFIFLILWAPTILYFALFWPSAHQIAAAAYGAYAGAYGMLCLQGLFYLSIGCLASALTVHQVIAAMISFSIMAAIFSAGILIESMNFTNPLLQELLPLFSPMESMKAFSHGLIDSRSIVFYLSMTGWLLFLTLQIFQSRKWRR